MDKAKQYFPYLINFFLKISRNRPLLIKYSEPQRAHDETEPTNVGLERASTLYFLIIFLFDQKFLHTASSFVFTLLPRE